MKNDFVDSILFVLERRRLRGDLILAYNILHGRLDFPQAEVFEAPAERNLRGHELKIRRRSFRLLRRKAAYTVKLPAPWNSLPNDIGTFKWQLDVAWPPLFPNRP